MLDFAAKLILGRWNESLRSGHEESAMTPNRHNRLLSRISVLRWESRRDRDSLHLDPILGENVTFSIYFLAVSLAAGRAG